MKKILLILLLILLCGCNSVINENSKEQESTYDFTIKDAYNNITCPSNAKTINLEDEDIYITSSGDYLLKGDLKGSIIVNTNKNGMVHLFFDGVNINSDNFASIYIKEADKVVITLLEDSINTLNDESEYIQIDDNDVDALIFSKADLIINGNGTLNVNANYKHGIVSKDDLVINGGTIDVVSQNQGIAGKDRVKIFAGNINIDCGKDAIKSDNDEDEYKGFVYIAGGNITIENADDAVQAYRLIEIVDGVIDIKNSYEGLESQYININGGTININSSDDGMNAVDKSNSNFGFGINQDASIKINDGTVYINADGDGIDSNGTIYLNGGQIIVDGPSSSADCAFDYETAGYANKGEIIMVGASGMAEDFSDDSTQCNLLYCLDKNYEANTKIVVKDANDNIIFEHTSTKSFSCIYVSSSSFSQGDTITISVGEDDYSYTLESITNSTGRGGIGSFDNEQGGMMPRGMGGGNFQEGEMNQREMGGDFKNDRFSHDENGFDPNNFERQNPPEMPEGDLPQKPNQ